jgi:hypothetical protein
LAVHGVVAALAAFVRFLRTFSAVRIVEQMIAGALLLHCKPFEVARKSGAFKKQ